MMYFRKRRALVIIELSEMYVIAYSSEDSTICRVDTIFSPMLYHF
jgi:hypothetical protein